MIYARTTALLGLILIIIPLLGIPASWKMILVFIVGVTLIYIGYKEYRVAERHRLAREDKTTTYTESVSQANESAPTV